MTGVILQRDNVAQTTQIHWGVSDRQIFRSWHRDEDLIEIEEPAVPLDKTSRGICLINWPEAVDGEYNPMCCRFPKSCSIPDE